MKTYTHLKNIAEKNMRQEFRLKNADETGSYLFEEIEQNELMGSKPKKFPQL